MSRGADLLARWLDTKGIDRSVFAVALASANGTRSLGDAAVLLDALTEGAVPANSWADPDDLAARVVKARALLGLDPGPS